MDRETTLLALLESKEAEANAKAEWIAAWVEGNRQPLLEGELDTDIATLLAEVNWDNALRINQSAYLLLTSGDSTAHIQVINDLIDAALTDLAHGAWSDHLAELQDAMSAEQWEQYQHRSAA